MAIHHRPGVVRAGGRLREPDGRVAHRHSVRHVRLFAAVRAPRRVLRGTCPRTFRFVNFRGTGECFSSDAPHATFGRRLFLSPDILLDPFALRAFFPTVDPPLSELLEMVRRPRVAVLVRTFLPVLVDALRTRQNVHQLRSATTVEGHPFGDKTTAAFRFPSGRLRIRQHTRDRQI